MKITDEIIEAGKSKKGGWTKDQLAVIGINWPPPKGWKKRVIGNEITPHQLNEFLTDKIINPGHR